MADFRKLLFVLIAGALLFTTVASAQTYSCSATPVQTLVRQEGLADYVGDVVLNCAGDVQNPALGIRDVNIRMTIDTPGVNITSNLLESSGIVTEATMIMNLGLTATGRQYIGYATAPTVPQSDGSQNVYQAVKVADNAVEWQGVVVAGPNSNPFSTIRLTNVRVNAASLPAGTAIIARVNITSPTSFPILNSASLTVANVIKAMTFSVEESSFERCVLPAEGETVGNFHLIYTENYGPAFRVEGAAATDNTIPGGNYPNESGFNPTPLLSGTDLIALASIGQADNPTQLQATIEHIPAGVSSISVDTYTVTGGGDITLSFLVSAITGTVPNRTATITASVTGVLAEALYLPNVVDIEVELDLDYTVPAPRGTITARGTLAPTSTVGVMSYIAPEPRFIDGGTTPLDVFTFAGVCHSLLLFPYITNQAGFDTGLVIANTSVDPLGTAPQEGACTLNYYGFTGGHAIVPSLQGRTDFGVAVTPTVPGGAQLIMLLSAGGGSVNPMGAGAAVACTDCAPMNQFQGYMIASCDFQFAHGYAFISDLGASKLAQGYLALIIPERFYQPEESVAPITLRQPQHSSLDAQGNQGEQLGN